MTLQDDLNRQLFNAATANDIEEGRHLITLGADLNWRHPGEYDFTPLHQAIRERHEPFAEMLIAHPHIDLTMRDALDRTPAEMAHMVGLHEIGFKIAEAEEAKAHVGPTGDDEPCPSKA